MSRIIPAAVQLIEEVTDQGRRVQVRAVDCPENGWHRSVSFDADTSKWLFKVLGMINDPRIASIAYDTDRRCVVTFVSEDRAHYMYEFGIEHAMNVLTFGE